MIRIRRSYLALYISLSLLLSACGGGDSCNNVEVSPPTITATTFALVSLSSLQPGAFSAGVAVNDNGSIVGLADDGIKVQAVRWDAASPATAATVLEPLAGNSYSAAYAVNNAGISVGESENAGTTSAVFWPDASTTASALPSSGLFGGGASTAYSINSTGQIAGESVNDLAGNTVAIYWQNSTASPLILTNLGSTSQAYSAAYGIGATGIIVGESLDDTNVAQAVAWLPDGAGGYAPPVVLDLPNNHVSGIAFNVDGAGRVAGETEEVDGTVHGVIWTLDALGAVTNLADLGPETSSADINDAGRVAGYNAAVNTSDSAFIWDGLDLSDQKELAPSFSHAYGINNTSQVVGMSDGEGFVAVPE